NCGDDAAAAGGTAYAKAATMHKLASSLTVRAIRPRTDMRSILIRSSCRSKEPNPGVPRRGGASRNALRGVTARLPTDTLGVLRRTNQPARLRARISHVPQHRRLSRSIQQ